MDDDLIRHDHHLTEVIRQVVIQASEQREEALARMLLEHPPGTRLCWHGPRFHGTGGATSFLRDVSEIRWTQEYHYLLKHETCSADVNRQQYRLP